MKALLAMLFLVANCYCYEAVDLCKEMFNTFDKDLKIVKNTTEYVEYRCYDKVLNVQWKDGTCRIIIRCILDGKWNERGEKQ